LHVFWPVKHAATKPGMVKSKNRLQSDDVLRD